MMYDQMLLEKTPKEAGRDFEKVKILSICLHNPWFQTMMMMMIIDVGNYQGTQGHIQEN